MMGRTAGLMSQTGCDPPKIIALELITSKNGISEDVTTAANVCSVSAQISEVVFDN